MAALDQISPEIISKIASIIGGKLKSLGEVSREAYGGVHAVAEMFNRLDSNTSKEILDKIESADPNLVANIRHLMDDPPRLRTLSSSGLPLTGSVASRRIWLTNNSRRGVAPTPILPLEFESELK